MSGRTNPGATSGAPASEALSQQAAVSSIKALAGDPRTTNLLLLAVVLCMAGLMPDSLMSICGA